MVKAADRRFAGGVKDGAEGQSLRLDNIHIKHKFAEPMEVSLDVVNGGVGNHAFYVISVHRTGRHGRHMLVSDRRGRICHCTQVRKHQYLHSDQPSIAGSLMSAGVQC
ncbi:hypothetical protein HaLaN_02200 [Haematococcus lacustris]|uniref:Uncharacterized protein n=1 Tax=Haematococcus lacustris TaxID=44745 RepID=A0A699YKB2_HAELA|nr:hypothetical protein HaLaN_02200 [Haematococcus lacustris]